MGQHEWSTERNYWNYTRRHARITSTVQCMYDRCCELVIYQRKNENQYHFCWYDICTCIQTMYVNLTDGNLRVLSYESLVNHWPTVKMLLTKFSYLTFSWVLALVIHMEIIPNRIFEYCTSIAQYYIWRRCEIKMELM
jgi:hypothetical protein